MCFIHVLWHTFGAPEDISTSLDGTRQVRFEVVSISHVSLHIGDDAKGPATYFTLVWSLSCVDPKVNWRDNGKYINNRASNKQTNKQAYNVVSLLCGFWGELETQQGKYKQQGIKQTDKHYSFSLQSIIRWTGWTLDRAYLLYLHCHTCTNLGLHMYIILINGHKRPAIVVDII